MQFPSRHSIDSRHLRYFLAVADSLSFRRAAEQLHIAQPALTRQVKALEEAMHVRLFDRDSHRVQLTAAGLLAQDRARRVLAEIDRTVDGARLTAAGSLGSLRIGFASHASYEYLPLITKKFRARYPGVGVRHERYSASLQYDPLLSETFDVVIVRPLYDDARITTRVLMRAPFVVAIPECHALLSRASISMADLACETLVTLPSRRGPNYQAQVLGFCLDAGFKPPSILEAEDVQALVGMVAAGLGVAIVSASAANLHVRGVAYRRLTDLAIDAVYVVASRRDASNINVERFHDVAAATMRDVARALDCQARLPLATPPSSQAGGDRPVLQ